MPTYKVHWEGTIYGESIVDAENEEQARKLAEEDKDRDWETDGSGYDWIIAGVEELEPDDLASSSGMPKYRVKFTTSTVDRHTVVVEANSPEEAEAQVAEKWDELIADADHECLSCELGHDWGASKGYDQDVQEVSSGKWKSVMSVEGA